MAKKVARKASQKMVRPKQKQAGTAGAAKASLGKAEVVKIQRLLKSKTVEGVTLAIALLDSLGGTRADVEAVFGDHQCRRDVLCDRNEAEIATNVQRDLTLQRGQEIAARLRRTGPLRLELDLVLGAAHEDVREPVHALGRELQRRKLGLQAGKSLFELARGNKLEKLFLVDEKPRLLGT